MSNSNKVYLHLVDTNVDDDSIKIKCIFFYKHFDYNDSLNYTIRVTILEETIFHNE